MSYNPNSGGNNGSLSFLFNGSPQASVSSYNQSSAQLPEYYTDYTQNMLNTAKNWASQPYPTYTGPLVASLNQDQQNSFGQVQNASQAYNGYAGAGANAVGAALNPNTSGLAAANPYLNEANQGIAAQVGQFMNPYLNQTNQNLAYQSGLNFQNTVAPALTDQFAAAGQLAGPGSTREGDMMNQAAYNQEQALGQAQATADSAGYNTAVQGASNQANLQGQLASTAGGLQQNANQLGITGGQTLAGIGQTGLNTALTGANALNTVGGQQQQQVQNNLNTAYQQFQNQFNWPITGLSAEQSALQGMQIPSANVQYSYGINPNAHFSPSGLNQLANIFSPTVAQQATAGQNTTAPKP
jgi:hypothetical protein